MLGIEIRPKVVDFVQRKIVALRKERAAAAAQGATTAAVGIASSASPSAAPPPPYDNVWAVQNNAQRFLPNFFAKGQLERLSIAFPDPHFKRKNHRKRIVSAALMAEYGYVMAPGGERRAQRRDARRVNPRPHPHTRPTVSCASFSRIRPRVLDH